MLAFPEDSFFSRAFDVGDFGFSDVEEEKVVFEAVDTDIEYELFAYDSCETSSLLSSRSCSSGSPSSSSSPCSSERDYGLDTYCLPDSFTDIDTENDFDLDFHSCSSSFKRQKHHNQPESRKRNQKRTNCSSQKKQRRKNDLDTVLTCLDCRWSELSTQRQQEVLEMLIGMVSQKLGLREQLELIKIICPDADVSPNDKEFFIDFELFDDEKFKGVCAFVKEHFVLMNDDEKETENDQTLTRRGSRKRQGERNTSSLWNEKSNNLQKKALAKTSRQIKKEKKSGLFKKEEVLLIKEKATSIPEEDEEELDVVG
ncbi:protein FAM199X-A-like [Rhopilema esculentum]|uniref:protein FAM199X-A-like n=1 Tax=Rhopilema esculentum TaxID=499914 RepID=UPI0031E27573